MVRPVIVREGGRSLSLARSLRLETKSARAAFGRALRMVILIILLAIALLSSTMLAREYQIFLLKSFVVAFLSLLPGWLYLHFIGHRGPELYDEYVLNLYRLGIDDFRNLPKPPPGSSYWKSWRATHSRDQHLGRNVYLRKFEAVYGRSAVPDSRRKLDENDSDMEKALERLREDTFSPVVWCTILLAVGCSIVVQPDLVRGLRPFGSFALTGLPRVPVVALRIGFIGSYVFIIQGLVRRYFQADLKPNAYVSALLRIIVVAGLLVALSPFLSGRHPAEVASTAFLIGIFPELGLRLLKHAALWFGSSLNLGDGERLPLTDLDGINLWSRARLFEEGIEDMENLTTANLLDLMLKTHVPVGRIVDWIDQAFLYVRVTDKKDREKLRRLGIRAATDLDDAFSENDALDPAFRPGLLRVLNTRANVDDGGPSSTEGLRRSLGNEVNLLHVRRWKSHNWLDAEAPAVSTES
jgi:hypothetical protein